MDTSRSLGRGDVKDLVDLGRLLLLKPLTSADLSRFRDGSILPSRTRYTSRCSSVSLLDHAPPAR